jgi:branched-chain amino acid transport system permease protein
MIALGQFLEVLIGGLMSGVLYSLVALGFVLIFKASGVFNFAQGVMVLFAALTLVGLMEHGLSVWLALGITTMVMIGLAFAIERVVLRPLVNQPPFTLLMATIGLTFFLQGLGELVWGSNVKKLNLGIPGHSIVLTVLFTDLADFTGYSEKYSPTEINGVATFAGRPTTSPRY